jgi:hypothetical protein
MAQGRTLGQTALRTVDPILHGCVDLILYRTVACPTSRHANPPPIQALNNLNNCRKPGLQAVPPARFLLSSRA